MKTPRAICLIVLPLLAAGAAQAQSICDPYLFTTFAGSPVAFGSDDGTGAAARFSSPTGVALDAARNVYVCDTGNHTIRRITPEGVVSTLAGQAGSAGSANGKGNAARFGSPQGVAVDSASNLYVAARFFSPRGVALDSANNVYIADTNNNTIRRLRADGVVNTLAGQPGSDGSDDGVGSAVRFISPQGLAVDSLGHVFVGDTGNNTIRVGGLASAYQTLDIARLPDGILLSGRATPNATVEIAAVTTLSATFVQIATVTADPTGFYQYTDADAGSFPRRFYRAFIPPRP